MKHRPSALTPAFLRRASLAAVALAGALLGGCLQDPGQTGLGYLNEQGVKLNAPLYHFTFENIPVDTVFTTTSDLDHFGDSQVVVGREGRFTASARLGFALTTALQHRHVDSGLALRFVPMHERNLIGNTFLSASAQQRDSLTLLVESFSWVDLQGTYQDSLTYYNGRLLAGHATFAGFDTALRRLDTIVISPSGAYGDTLNQDTSQLAKLPNLQERLRTVGDSTNKWAIFLNITPLPGRSDSGMFRFSSQVFGSTAHVRTYGSGLWLGRHAKDSVTTVGLLLPPYRIQNSNRPGSNYEIKYTGPSTRSILIGVQRGVHLRLNRDTLLARVKAALGADSTVLGAAPTGKFDGRFFVPYAELRIPLRDSLNHVDGPFAYDMTVLSDVDSVADGEALGNVSVSLDNTIGLPVTGNGTSTPLDTLRVTYRLYPQDTTRRQVALSWAKDPDVVDTFLFVPDGSPREVLSKRHGGWLRQTTLSVTPSPSALSIGVYFATGVTEPSFFRDSTGDLVGENAGLKRRFYRPGADSLSLRVTRGIGKLLNRLPASSMAPDLYIRGVERAAYDTSTVNGKTYNRVSFPVMGEIGIPRDPDGKLRVGLDLYLYPLEGGQ